MQQTCDTRQRARRWSPQEALWQKFMSDQPHQNTLHFLNAHVHIFNHSSVQHACRNIPPPTFLLQIMETLENDTFPAGKTVSDVWEVVTRITGIHMKFPPAESTRYSVADALRWYIPKYV